MLCLVSSGLSLTNLTAQEHPSEPESREKGDREDRDKNREHGRSRDWNADRGSRGGEGSPFMKLSDEERQQVRAALAKVWNDPKVKAARDDIKVANDAHRQALKDAMADVDPKIREVLAKVMDSHFRDGGEGRRLGPGGMMRPDFSDEEGKIMKEAYEKAMETEVMKAIKADGASGGRESKEFRESLQAEMIRIDPRVGELMKKGFGGGGGPSRPPKSERGGEDEKRRPERPDAE